MKAEELHAKANACDRHVKELKASGRRNSYRDAESYERVAYHLR
jgi:hypothetical protein